VGSPMTTWEKGRALDCRRSASTISSQESLTRMATRLCRSRASRLNLAWLGIGGAAANSRPSARRLLERVLNSGTGRFSALIAKIVERSLTYRKRSNPVTRDEIDRLNAALLASDCALRADAGDGCGFPCRGRRPRKPSLCRSGILNPSRQQLSVQLADARDDEGAGARLCAQWSYRRGNRSPQNH
jgi:hypothetical protein